MDEIIKNIKLRPIQTPTRLDIAELLASVGKPGEKLDEKEQAVLDLFEAVSAYPNNSQGHSVVSTLDSYEEM